MKKGDTKKEDKKIVIDLNAEQIVNFKGHLGVSDTFLLLEILNDLEKQMEAHLKQVLVATHIEFGRECATKKELEEKLSPEEAIEIIERLWK